MHLSYKVPRWWQKSKIAMNKSIGDAWLVCGLVWRIGVLLRRNTHVVMLVPESDPFLL